MTTFEETRQAMRDLVAKCKKISQSDFEHILAQHQKFLSSGGAGGKWETFYITNLIFGTYRNGLTSAVEGKQAKINFYDLAEIELMGVRLQYADCAGIKAENKSWAESDLEGSLLIDSILPNCDFRHSDLFGADFSRSDMRNCDFRGASLIETDFENCDLSNADFRGAQIDQTTKFKGAILVGAKFDT
jgi:uncharacterized protein YjbI with pentapeptide repeats